MSLQLPTSVFSRVILKTLFVAWMAFFAGLCAAQSETDGQYSTSLSLQQLGASKWHMRTTYNARDLYIGVRLDEVVQQAKLTLTFTPSPALVAKLSHLRILLNDQLVTVITLTDAMLGTRIQRDITLDPRWFTDDNWLRVEAINHYSGECEDPMHLSLWNEIDTANSTLHLTVKRVDVSDDLSLLPAPFFDRHDARPLVLPVLLGNSQRHDTLQVAGMLASWFGALAGYRTAQFPVVSTGLPTKHALVLATPDGMPSGLALPKFQGPAVHLMRHPQDKRIKLLVIQGRNAQELKTAALSLILGQQVLNGTTVNIKAIDSVPRRAAYDAPAWIPTDRPVRLGELVDNPKRLELVGVAPESIELHWRTPPDLWLRQGQGAALDLRYRASSAPKHAQGDLLRLSLNDTLIRSWNLPSVEPAKKSSMLSAWTANNKPFEQVKVRLFDFQLGMDNNIAVTFPLGVKPVNGWCAWRVESTAAAIDASSTLDFSELPHYIRMPELAAFANSGFPFSRYADLAETTVVLPAHPSEQELQTYLTTMGSFGRWTGSAALHFALIEPQAVQQHGDSDLLLIGAQKLLPLLEKWQRTPVWISATQRRVSVSSESISVWRRWWSSWPTSSPSSSTSTPIKLHLDTNGDIALIQGFESPLHSGRSVIALTSTQPEGLLRIGQALLDPKRTAAIQGDVALVQEHQVQSLIAGPFYYVGHLSLSGHFSRLLTEHAVLAGTLALALLAVLVWLTRQLLIRRAAMRLGITN